MANNFTDLLFRAAQDVGIPELQKTLGLQSSTERQLVSEANYYNRLNGSGAPDPDAALMAAANERELNNPRKFAWGDAIKKSFSPSNAPMILAVVALGLFLFLFLKRR